MTNLRRHVWAALASLALAGFGVGEAIAQAVLSPPEAQVFAWGHVNAIARQADGKLIVGGSFTRVGTAIRNNLARFNADGTLDGSWNPVVGGTVSAIVIGAGGEIYVGGQTTLLRIFPADGSVDPLWRPFLSGVNALALDGNGNLFAAGYNFLAKISTQGFGQVDPDWLPNPNQSVVSISADGAGNLYALGYFSSIGGQQRNFLAKLSTTGSGAADPLWNPNPNSQPMTVLPDGAGNVYVGGFFLSIGGANRTCIARLSANGTGTADPSWTPNPTGYASDAICNVRGLALDGANRLYASGSASVPDEGMQRYILHAFVNRITTSGQLDNTWHPPQDMGDAVALVADSARLYLSALGLSVLDTSSGSPISGWSLVYGPGTVSAIGRDGSGRILLGGSFIAMGDGTPRSNLARLLVDGSIDPSWHPLLNGEVTALAVDSNDDVFISGRFGSVGTDLRTHLAKVPGAGSGTADPDWNPGLDGTGFAIAADSAGRLYVGGFFFTAGGLPRHNIARFSASGSGSVDSLWNPDPDGYIVVALALHGLDSIYAGGSFATIGGQSRSNLAKLNTSGIGAADPVWNPVVVSSENGVYALALAGDGRLYVGGDFSSINGFPISNLARVETAGAGLVDQSWTPEPESHVVALALDGGNSIYVATPFWSHQGFPIGGVVRVFTDGNGAPYAGWSAMSRGRVLAVMNAPEGGVHAGGDFDMMANQPQSGYARLAPVPNVPAPLDVDGNGRYDALTDGLICLRFLFGLRGDPMISNALGGGATVVDPAAIAANISDHGLVLDIDGSGRDDALTDGILLLRYLFGVRGSPLVSGAVGAGATRRTAAEIESYLQSVLH